MTTVIRLLEPFGGQLKYHIDRKKYLQDINVPCYGENQCHVLQRFRREDEAKTVYRSLQKMHDDNIARPVYLFRECGSRRFYLSVEKKGTKLSDFVLNCPERRNEFFLVANGTSYALSNLYVSLLRGLINGITVLQDSEITAKLFLTDIYIIQHSSKTGDASLQCVLMNYSLRADHLWSNRNFPEDDWRTLGRTLEILNERLGLTCHQPAHCQMESLIVTLKNAKGLKPKKVLDHPIFWSWRRRKDLIIHLCDVLVQQDMTWNNFDTIADAFQDWEKIKSHFVLPADEPAPGCSYDEGGVQVDRSQGNKIRVPDEDDEEKAKKNRRVIDCIRYMRNVYCHFYEKRHQKNGNSSQKNYRKNRRKLRNNPITNKSIKKPEEVENLFNRIVPNAIYKLVPVVERMEDRFKGDGIFIL